MAIAAASSTRQDNDENESPAPEEDGGRRRLRLLQDGEAPNMDNTPSSEGADRCGYLLLSGLCSEDYSLRAPIASDA